MEFYTNSYPKLITEHIEKKFSELLDETINKNKNIFELFYENTIRPNITITIVICIIIAYLFYRYHTRKHTPKNERYTPINANAHLKQQNNQFVRTTMNPYHKQQLEERTDPLLDDSPDIQYTGPFYGKNIGSYVSDDEYSEFLDVKNENLNEYDDLIEQKNTF